MEVGLGDQVMASATSRIDIAFNSPNERARLLLSDECDAVIAWAEANPAGWERIAQSDVSYNGVMVDQSQGDKKSLGCCKN